MKLIAGVILSLSLLELFHCVPLIGSDDGGFKETNTSSSWGYNAGIDGNLGLDLGLKGGVGIVGIKKHLGVSVGGDRANSQKETTYAINPVPAPNNPGSGLGYPGYPATGALNYPAAGSPYYPAPGSQYYPESGSVYYPAPGSQYYNQFAPQPNQQWPTPYGQNTPQAQEAQQYVPAQRYALPQQYASVPQYVPAQQFVPQYAPAQQFVPQYAPAQQYAPVPQYVQQGAQQQVPQDTPQHAPANGTPNNIDQENLQ